MNTRLPHPVVLAAGAAALAVGFYLWVAAPLADGLTVREKRLEAGLRAESEAKRLAAGIEGAQQGPPAPARPEGFTIFSFVEGAATREGVKDHVEFMRPANRDVGGGRREMAVDLRLSGLPMERFLAFLQQVEAPALGVRVRQLILQPSPKGGLDADMSVAVVLDRPR
ncbi:type II secretion system protein GspM [Solidesulfovibrio sp.]|uniref:type II secretion system protein GspM n=1 Tax=Solidesulfovibrio sp. TaxID=2910990 RepID=UPI0026223EC0|nr:type II secretion system protein GspM [Solidesulfovibrio sp.]